MPNPYQELPPEAFWRTAVADRAPLEISQLWKPKSPLAVTDRVATFGSCFAQHFSRALKARGYTWFDAELAPGALGDRDRLTHNYGVFSARTGNIYTAAALKQWVYWALGRTAVPDEIWESNGRFFDPFRPAIEPDGFASREALEESRQQVLSAMRDAIAESQFFVFTMGLTEGWVNRPEGYDYAVCPGTLAGEFNPERHVFKNYTYPEIYDDMSAALSAMRQHNAELRFILTVSPVPLTATASGRHVITATTHSKSVLRAVAGALAETQPDVDYFPSYEIIAAPPWQGMFYNDNKRTVKQAGVDFVMDSFFACLRERFGPTPPTVPEQATEDAQDEELVCEEQMLAAFGPGGAQRVAPSGAGGFRLCVLGNSHLAALRFAIRERLFDPKDIDFVFWGLAGKQMETVDYKDGCFSTPLTERVLAVSDGRYGTLPAHEFDAFVFHGVPLRLPTLLTDLVKGCPDIRAYPRTELYRLIAEWLEAQHTYSLAKSLRADFAGQILLSPPPYPVERNAHSTRRTLDAGEIALVESCVRDVLSAAGFGYVGQPQETVINLIHTRQAFNVDGPTIFDLDKTHVPNTRHMNGVYGAHLLRAFTETLGARRTSSGVGRAAADRAPQPAVQPTGADFVTTSSFAPLRERFGPTPPSVTEDTQPEELVCEEQMLAAFGPGTARAEAPISRSGSRICIFGNSHIAALRLAVRDGLFTAAGIDIVFWDLPGHRVKTISYQDGYFSTPLADKAFAVSDGRYGSLPAADFDAFLFHGAQLRPPALRGHLVRLREPAPNMRQVTADWLAGQHLYTLARALRADFNGRIVLSPAPFVAEPLEGRRARADDAVAAVVHASIRDTLAADGIEYLEQPPETVTGHLYTRAAFHSARPVLTDRERVYGGETRHMNGDYGAQVMRTFIASLDADRTRAGASPAAAGRRPQWNTAAEYAAEL